MDNYLAVLKKYAVFSGRATRREFWMFVLFNILISVGLGIVDAILHIRGTLGGIYSLAVFLPSLAVSIRRLHDIGKSGWWIFIVLIPLIGAIVLIVFYATKSQRGDNQYGPNPAQPSPEATV